MKRKKNEPLTIDVVSLFPGMFQGPWDHSIIGRAREKGLLQVTVHDLRQWSDDLRHRKVDDRPYGGGAGMVIQPEPIYRAIQALSKGKRKPWVIFLSPQGKVLSHSLAQTLADRSHLVLLCGHYEGVDERIMRWVDQEISIGDYVLTGGELPAMVLVDVVARFVPGVVGDQRSVENDSFSRGILDHPHYTRPSLWRGRKVPDVLLSGNHKAINEWRQKQAIKRTIARRPVKEPKKR